MRGGGRDDVRGEEEKTLETVRYHEKRSEIR